MTREDDCGIVRDAPIEVPPCKIARAAATPTVQQCVAGLRDSGPFLSGMPVRVTPLWATHGMCRSAGVKICPKAPRSQRRGASPLSRSPLSTLARQASLAWHRRRRAVICGKLLAGEAAAFGECRTLPADLGCCHGSKTRLQARLPATVDAGRA